jgi:hypothetical protein
VNYSGYVTGQTKSPDFKTTPGALHESPLGGVTGFVSKINAEGTQLVYSTYLGGSLEDDLAGIAVDEGGNAYVTGQGRSSADFTTLTPMRAWAGGPADAFVAKLNANGTAMLNFTYLGGSSADGGSSIALDQAGNIYVTGYTASTNFPLVNAFQNVFRAGIHDAFAAKIDAAWSGLVYSTYLGGSQQDDGHKIGVDSAGCAYVMGATRSGSDFPTKNSLQPYRAISSSFCNIFVTKFSPSGRSLVYSTFLGGNLESVSSLFSLAVDRAGNAYVAGETHSSNYPTKNALQPELRGYSDGFVTKIASPESGAAVDLLLLGD